MTFSLIIDFNKYSKNVFIYDSIIASFFLSFVLASMLNLSISWSHIEKTNKLIFCGSWMLLQTVVVIFMLVLNLEFDSTSSVKRLTMASMRWWDPGQEVHLNVCRGIRGVGWWLGSERVGDWALRERASDGRLIVSQRLEFERVS